MSLPLCSDFKLCLPARTPKQQSKFRELPGRIIIADQRAETLGSGLGFEL